MPNKQIYLTDELMKEAKSIANFSELIQTLFKEHLLKQKSIPALISEKEKLEAKAREMLKENTEETNHITQIIKEVEKVEGDKEAVEFRKGCKLADKITECYTNVKDMFDIEITPEEAEEYLSGRFESLKNFLIKIGKWKE